MNEGKQLALALAAVYLLGWICGAVTIWLVLL